MKTSDNCQTLSLYEMINRSQQYQSISRCGKWDLNPHDLAATRTLILLVYQFRHSRILLIIFASLRSTRLSLKPFFKEMMQKKGLEPSRHCCHRHLKPARLPIPPLLRTRCIIHRTLFYVKQIIAFCCCEYFCNCQIFPTSCCDHTL